MELPIVKKFFKKTLLRSKMWYLVILLFFMDEENMLNTFFPKGSSRRNNLSRIKEKLSNLYRRNTKAYYRLASGKFFFKINKRISYYGFYLYYSPGTSIVERFINTGSYEPGEVTGLTEIAIQDERPTVFLDIGANIGMISMALLHSVPEATIYAFEPGEHQREYLEKNVSSNNLTKRIRISPLALSDKKGTASFAVHDPFDASGDGLRDTGRAGDCSFCEVQTDTLDNWWEENGRPTVTLIKMDVEGAEYFVFRGGSRILKICRPIVLFEAHATNLKAYSLDVNELLSIVREQGYRICTLDGREVTQEVLELFDNDGFGSNFIAYPLNWQGVQHS